MKGVGFNFLQQGRSVNTTMALLEEKLRDVFSWGSFKNKINLPQMIEGDRLDDLKISSSVVSTIHLSQTLPSDFKKTSEVVL